MTKYDQITIRILENLIDDEEFISAFCLGCPEILKEYGQEFYPVDFIIAHRRAENV